MNPTGIGIAIFAFTLGGALLGMLLRTRLPEGQLDNESKDTVRLGVGLIANDDGARSRPRHRFRQELLRCRGSWDTAVRDRPARSRPRPCSLWTRNWRDPKRPAARSRGPYRYDLGVRLLGAIRLDPIRAEPTIGAEGLTDAIRALSPRDEVQRSLQLRALELAETLLRARWLAIVVTRTSIPVPFLMVLLFWLTLTFTSFGLFAPRNMLVVTVLVVCALSVASAVFLVLEMDGPFDGLLRVSPDPLRRAHELLNR